MMAGPVSGGGAPPPTSSSPVLIQRLIILHDGLMPLPPSKSHQRRSSSSSTSKQQQQRRNPQALLSENASLDEHGEFILYYYDHSLHFSHEEGSTRRPTTAVTTTATYNGSPTHQFHGGHRRSSNASDTSMNSTRGEKIQADYATEEAVRFAGICRALRSLPGALHAEKHHHHHSGEGNGSRENNDNEEETVSETDVVHLNDSTLVFVPLELNGDIVAIAQVRRRYYDFDSKYNIWIGSGPCQLLIWQQLTYPFAVLNRFLVRTIHR